MMAPVPNTDSAERGTSSQIWAVARHEACVWTTALGRPVVPEV
jgi:hypothetical protein